MEAPAMPSRKSEIVAKLRIVACEKLCLSCYFPALTSFLDEKLGHLEKQANSTCFRGATMDSHLRFLQVVVAVYSCAVDCHCHMQAL